MGTRADVEAQIRFANWLAAAIAVARGQPMPAPRNRWTPKDLKALDEEQISFFTELRAIAVLEGERFLTMDDVRKVAEFAESAREQARRDKAPAALYTDLAVRLEALSAQLRGTLEAQDEMVAEMPRPSSDS